MDKVYKDGFLKIGIIFIVLSCVSSCGQKGPLYYPDKNNVSSSDFQYIH